MIVSDSTKPNGAIAAAVGGASAAMLPWCGDRGDGTYRNPILFADYSDPDVVRVGDDYWLTASSFGHVPGLPILHSRDLVNWTLVNHALPQLVPVEHFRKPRHGQGVWAPAIRHHAGKFWIYYPDPDFGLYVVTADDPCGDWSTPHLVMAGKGAIDPCPLWDDDGTGYLIHGWAKSRSGVCNRLTLHRLTPDHRGVVDTGRVVIDGSSFEGWHTIEGPKLHKRDGHYYVFAPAGGVGEGYQAVFRARTIEGPYEARIVLERGRTTVNGPHQGAWVDTPQGEHWFFHFQEMPAYGRVVHLQPMRWRDDGWPVIGDDPDDRGCGEPVLVHPKPTLPVAPIAVPATSDDFRRAQLGRQWQWQGNPQMAWAAFRPEGGLHLSCVPQTTGESLWSAPNILLQKFPGPAFRATAALRLESQADGDRAGLIVFGHDYAWIGLRRDREGVRVVVGMCFAADHGGAESEAAARPFDGGTLQVRVEVEPGATCQFSFAEVGGEFTKLGPTFQAKSSTWVGAKVGLFAATEAAEASVASGCAAVHWFEVAAPQKPYRHC